MLFENGTDSDAGLDQKSVTKAEVGVPQPSTHIQAENVREEGDNPLEQEDAALDLQVDHELSQSGHTLLEQAHVAVEKDVDFGHLEGVEVVEEVAIHHIGEAHLKPRNSSPVCISSEPAMYDMPWT
mgnify:CR=1 FL=1